MQGRELVLRWESNETNQQIIDSYQKNANNKVQRFFMVNLNTNKLDSLSYHNGNHNHLSNYSSNVCDKSNYFTIFHQNVRGISHKIDELLISLTPNTPQFFA